MSTLAPKGLKSLLAALAKRGFKKSEEDLGNDVLLSQLWAGDADRQPEEIFAEINTWEDLLGAAASGYWDTTKLLEKASALQLSAEHTKILAAFWNNEREKIHDVLVRRSNWSGHFSKLSWRVDVKAVGKSTAALNEPVALLEFRTSDGLTNGITKKQSQTQFEMNRAEILELLTTLGSIDSSFNKESY